MGAPSRGDYPSPESESEPYKHAHQADLVMNASLPKKLNGVARPKVAMRRTQEPPRNAEGQIYCDHLECRDNVPIFRRPCEWNKHMDKHDRPYKCMEPECEKMPGFTYSGGLLRHQREVHKMHSPAKRLMCPHPDCRRSTGNGFTRHENLREHIRRLHRGVEVPIPRDVSDHSDSISEHQAKRRRLDGDAMGDMSPIEPNYATLQDEIIRLRHENNEKDRRLDHLERLVKDLQRFRAPGACAPAVPMRVGVPVPTAPGLYPSAITSLSRAEA